MGVGVATEKPKGTERSWNVGFWSLIWTLFLVRWVFVEFMNYYL